ncbi:hypothetical protein BHM03_00035140, partial [Ensete ventricosum]
MRPDPMPPSLDNLDPGGNSKAVARAAKEAVSFIASSKILRLLLRRVLRSPYRRTEIWPV